MFNSNKKVSLNILELVNTSGVEFSHETKRGNSVFNIDPKWQNSPDMELPKVDRIYKQYTQDGLLVRVLGYIKGDK